MIVYDDRYEALSRGMNRMPMTWRHRCCYGLIGLFAAGSCRMAVPGSAQQAGMAGEAPPLVFSRVTVIDGIGNRPLPDVTVVVAGGRNGARSMARGS